MTWMIRPPAAFVQWDLTWSDRLSRSKIRSSKLVLKEVYFHSRSCISTHIFFRGVRTGESKQSDVWYRETNKDVLHCMQAQVDQRDLTDRERKTLNTFTFDCYFFLFFLFLYCRRQQQNWIWRRRIIILDNNIFISSEDRFKKKVNDFLFILDLYVF